MERIVMRCLEKEPERRYANAVELATELRRPHEGEAPRLRELSGGDGVVLDPGEATDWALVLTSAQEKTGWSEGMTLRFEDRYYRLVRAQAPSAGAAWTYRFTAWPEGEIFRRLVDYEQDQASRVEQTGKNLTGRLSRWLGRREEERDRRSDTPRRRPR
jgi:hypothetical protein